MHNIGIFWFNTDLRVLDNPALMQASQEVDRLICIYCLPPSSPVGRAPNSLSDNRLQFLQESLAELDHSLGQLGQRLKVMYEPALEAIAQLIARHNIDAVYSSSAADYYINESWRLLKQRYSMITFSQTGSCSLINPAQLSFPLDKLPESFSKFRRKVESVEISNPIAAPKSLPQPPAMDRVSEWQSLFPVFSRNPITPFRGGESHGIGHLQRYFSRNLASSYKETRNGLDGMDYSTKFSPWLANGNLSARTIMSALTGYERSIEKNESTYWIYFELLWRDYFYFYALKHGVRLFSFTGIKQNRPSTSFYAERYQKWCQGNTPYPIVNACMHQLNRTGYLSNRGRQLVASCFVHELNLDWRFGASYFEQQLIDYDVASNWGNWQYLAGVGSDPRGHRRFDLIKQTKIYDPSHTFIQKWAGGDCSAVLDSVDAADWPMLDTCAADDI
ncbi:MAG: DASH family cryptochrome [Halioglobus sp.]|nr:DASH family cryptochrome [Halioglobus sp.]